MPTDSSASLKNLREKSNLLTEVSDAEKQLWACIPSKGVLNKDVKCLYHKACCIYEKLFLSENELSDLQNIEYLLWRLHYKHIDEFRRRISQTSSKEEHKLSASRYVEGFKLFLSEAAEFYQNLIRKIKRYYSLVDEPWFYKSNSASRCIEQAKLHKCQFVCHRICICLGDLARYLELYEKPDEQQRNWSVAASYYLEAAKIYPDGGNPQNQLAVLATYIGDEFLALYHCLRSLAVKEPFPDALKNLILLFERNRSNDIGSLSNEVYDSSKPSDWISGLSKADTKDGFSSKTTLKSGNDQSMPRDIWALVIRTTSFFFLDSSLDNFLCTFTSTLRELEALLALDVVKLSSSLESYKNMNLSKAGPYRALHLISLLLFIIHNLTNESQQKILNPTNKTHQAMLLKLAWTVTFICMGRLVDRCLKGSPVIYFPLLPALLVFVEWLVVSLDKVHVEDERCENAMSYFFDSFVKLLNYLQENRAEVTIPDHIALWEDYELRGFTPLSHAHSSLDFSSCWEEQINYKMKNEYRAHRIVQAAIKIANISTDSSTKRLFHSKLGRKFSTMEAKEPMEEEEDIVFEPIARHNSEPIPMDGQAITSSSNECLRRTSSLFGQHRSATIHSVSTSATSPATSSKQTGSNGTCSNGFTQVPFPEGPIAAGPPSLSSWVLNDKRLSSERTNGTERSVLAPIEEIASEELRGLSLTSISSSFTCPPPYCAPVPSASLLPENAIRLTSNSAGFPLTNAATNVTTSSVHHTGPSIPTFVESKPWSEPQFQRAHHHAAQEQYYAPRNFNARFDLLEGWGPPLLPPSSSLLRGLCDQKRDPLRNDYQRPDPQSLLQYLKQRECQLQQESQFTGSYMQN